MNMRFYSLTVLDFFEESKEWKEEAERRDLSTAQGRWYNHITNILVRSYLVY